MNNDLISREALKKDIMSYKTMPEIRKAICEVIDNAPTVEAEKAKESEIIKAYTKGFDTGVETVKDERPQGEWKDESRDSLLCTCCNKRIYKPFIGGFPTERSQHYYPNFCAFCGADMRRGGAE